MLEGLFDKNSVSNSVNFYSSENKSVKNVHTINFYCIFFQLKLSLQTYHIGV